MASPRRKSSTRSSEFLATIGIKLAKGQVVKPSQFNDILAKVRGTEHENVVNEIVLRTQAQAEYVAENYGHFGLHLRRYAHFTSPIRRYADLIVHRALVRALDLGAGGLPEMGREHLAEIAARISAAERRAMAAERETTDRLIATFLAEHIGATFSTAASPAPPAPACSSKLADTGADGFVPAATLGNDYFAYDEAHHALIGSRTGETFQLGDLVTVKLMEAAPFAGALRFEMQSKGKMRPARGAGAAQISDGAKRRHTTETRMNGPLGKAQATAWRRSARSGRRSKRGMRKLCPACGQGQNFLCAISRSPTPARIAARNCIHHRADDMPPYVTMFIAGHFVVAGLMAAQELWPGFPRLGPHDRLAAGRAAALPLAAAYRQGGADRLPMGPAHAWFRQAPRQRNCRDIDRPRTSKRNARCARATPRP